MSEICEGIEVFVTTEEPSFIMIFPAECKYQFISDDILFAILDSRLQVSVVVSSLAHVSVLDGPPDSKIYAHSPLAQQGQQDCPFCETPEFVAKEPTLERSAAPVSVAQLQVYFLQTSEVYGLAVNE